MGHAESVKYLKNKKKDILEQWVNNQLAEDGLRYDLISNDDQRAQSEELLNSLIDSMDETDIGDVNSPEFAKVRELFTAVSIARARQGFTARETGAYVFSLKEAILQTLAVKIKDMAVLYADSMQINKLIDNLVTLSFETFIKGREEVILRQTNELSELSTPVIRVWEGIVALPIIGTLDSSRTQVVMESLLQEIVETGSTIAILDISGVPAVDSLVAQHLIKTVSATRLMGAECIISGIRPEIAQTIVHLGIDLSNIVTKATLASALKFSFSMLQIEVSKKK